MKNLTTKLQVQITKTNKFHLKLYVKILLRYKYLIILRFVELNGSLCDFCDIFNTPNNLYFSFVDTIFNAPPKILL